MSHRTMVACACALGLCTLGPVHAADILFKRHVIDAETDFSAAAIIDVNRDGQPDIVCGSHWYEGPTWTRHFLAEVPRIGGRPDGFSHLPFDVNRDGWTDVITVNYRSRSIKWMEHPGPSLGPWQTHVAVEPGPMETGRLVDIDGDGRLDLLPNGANFAAWWEFRWPDEPSVGEPAWIRHDLPEVAGGHGLGFGDINGDGRGDIVAQNGWLEAPADARHGKWVWHADFHLERASIPMLVVDVDDDGDRDLIWCSAHGFGVYWLEQFTHRPDNRRWVRHAIDTTWSQGHSPLWYDLDDDGRPELITGKRYMAHGGSDPGEYDPIAIYRYQYNRRTETWQRWTVSDFGQRVGTGLDPKVGDIDGDGDADLLMSGRSGLYWLENTMVEPLASVAAPRTDAATDELLTVVSADGSRREIEDAESWGLRRWQILDSIEATQGPLPDSLARVRLKTTIQREERNDTFRRQLIEYQVDADHRVSAQLLIPTKAQLGESTGLVCSLAAEHRHVADRLASEGFVCLVTDAIPLDQANPAQQAWQLFRAADVLQASEFVHGERLGFVGDLKSTPICIQAVALDQRLVANVIELGDDSPAGGPRRLAEWFACVAPRALRIYAPRNSAAAAVVERARAEAKPVYELRRATENFVSSNSRIATDEHSVKSTVDWLKQRFQPRSRPRRGGRKKS